MKVREFCQVLNLDDSGVRRIELMIHWGGKIMETALDEAYFGYGNRFDKYRSVADWFIKEWGDWEILRDCHLDCLALTLYADIVEGGNKNGKTL